MPEAQRRRLSRPNGEPSGDGHSRSHGTCSDGKSTCRSARWAFLWWRPLQDHIVEPRTAARNGVSSFQRVAVLTGGMAAETRRRSAVTRPSPQSRLDGVQRDSSRPMMERGPPNTRKVRSLK